MIPVVFVNCRKYPFLSMIESGSKEYETRSRDTLKRLVGCTVYLAETGKGKWPFVKISAKISEVVAVRTRFEYEKYRTRTQIKKGSMFDWTDSTKVKYLYKLTDVKPVPGFHLSPDCVRHGRVWAEYEPTRT